MKLGHTENTLDAKPDESQSRKIHPSRRCLLQNVLLWLGSVFLPYRTRLIAHHSTSGEATRVEVAPSTTESFLTHHQFETMDVICEMIIPQTRTAGARAAKVTQFIDLLLAEGEVQLRTEIVAGLRWLDQRSREVFGQDFVGASPNQQLELVTRISSADSLEAAVGRLFFQRAKSLTVFGYYTSREGLTQELGYAGPSGIGTYEGSAPVTKGTK